MLGVGLVTNLALCEGFAKMGASSSQQFRQALQRGDEDTALFLYHSHPDLHGLNPTKCYGVIRKTTLLHYSVKRGFFQLFREFLVNGANPNAENYKKQSVVHEICITTQSDQTVAETRAEMLQFLINFCTDPTKACPDAPGPLSPQLLNLNKQDSAFNTPLHLAAASGLLKCVEIFLFHGAQVHVLNIAGQTPFDCARVAHHEDIMSLLEPKMVFSHSKDSDLLKTETRYASAGILPGHEGTRPPGDQRHLGTPDIQSSRRLSLQCHCSPACIWLGPRAAHQCMVRRPKSCL